MTRKVGYCDLCNNTGEVDCHCGGDLCACGQEVEPCPGCDGGDAILGEYETEDDDDEEPGCVTPQDRTPADLKAVLGEALAANSTAKR